MADVCGGLTSSPNSNAVCSPGFTKGGLFYEELPSEKTDAAMILAATFDADALLDQPNRMYNLSFFITEGVEPEIIEEEGTDGQLITTQTKEGASSYEVVASIGGYKSLFAPFENSKTMYYFPYTDTNVIRGKEINPNTFLPIKIRMSTSYKPATGDTVEKIVIKIQELEDWRPFATQVKATAFQYKEIATVQGMTFTEVSNSLTTLVVSAKNLDKIGITSLSTTGAGEFVLTNTTDSAAITVTGVTLSGSNYTLAFIAQDEADAYSLSYGEPSATSELYDLTTTITGTLNA